MPAKKTKAVELPSAIVYYNLWTSFESKEIGRLFKCFPHKEAAKLKKKKWGQTPFFKKKHGIILSWPEFLA